MTTADRLKVCGPCDRRQAKCHGPCACTIDGRDIIDHAREGRCPLNRFRWRGLGDAVAWALERSGVAAAWYRALADIEPHRAAWRDDEGRPVECGCAGRQTALNRLVPL